MSKLLVDEIGGNAAAATTIASGKNITGTASQFQMTDVVQGDVLYGSAADTLSRLAPGTAGQVLQTQGAGANPIWAADAAGKVLQVVQTVKTDTTSTSSTLGTLVDITGMAVAITPSAATSKVLVFWNITVGCVANTGINIRLLRDAATPVLGDAASSRTRVTALVSSSNANIMLTGSGMYLDSPSSTSSTTYKLQWSADWATTVYLNRSNADTDAALMPRSTSTITAMEIGA